MKKISQSQRMLIYNLTGPSDQKKKKKNQYQGIFCEFQKIKDKENIQIAFRVKKKNNKVIHKGMGIRLTLDFSIETQGVRRQWNDVFKILKRNDFLAQNSILEF